MAEAAGHQGRLSSSAAAGSGPTSRHVGEQAQSPAGPDPSRALIRALRYRADEVQLGRALHAVARQGGVARDLAQALLESVAPPFRKAAWELLPVPPDVVCGEQRELFADVGRTRLRRRRKSMGRVDLDFAQPTGDWKLAVELKIDSDFGVQQRPRYESSGRPLLAVVRDPTRDDLAMGGEGWRGAVGWSDLLPRLRGLEVTPSELRQQWRLLLDVAEADGDFAVRRSPPATEVAANRALLEPLRDTLRETSRDLVASRYPNAQAFVADIEISSVRSEERRASLFVSWRRWGDGRIVVEVGDATSAVSEMATWWLPPLGRRDQRQLRAAHRALVREKGYTHVTRERYRADDQVAGNEDARRSQILEAFERRAAELIQAGCLESELRQDAEGRDR